LYKRPARGQVLRASASVLAGREFGSWLGLTKTLQNGTAAFLPDAQCAEELQGTHPEHKKKPGNSTNSVVALQDHCSYKAPTTNQHI